MVGRHHVSRWMMRANVAWRLMEKYPTALDKEGMRWHDSVPRKWKMCGTSRGASSRPTFGKTPNATEHEHLHLQRQDPKRPRVVISSTKQSAKAPCSTNIKWSMDMMRSLQRKYKQFDATLSCLYGRPCSGNRLPKPRAEWPKNEVQKFCVPLPSSGV